ncbi:MAG: isoaspartyl peptidase/L-asparaginase family protein [Solirubrobacteraceae bacterium]
MSPPAANPGAPGPVLVIHAGAGLGSAADGPQADEHRAALRTALQRGRAILEAHGDAVDAVAAAVAHLEDEAPFFNAGRGSVLCADGSVEMSAALMRGHDRAAGAVAAICRTRLPVLAARAVLERSSHVLLLGDPADQHAAAAGLEQRDPSYFVTERQRERLRDLGTDFTRGTVGAVCLDGHGRLAAATSTGGRRGQAPGRVGDTPVIGAGTWADPRVAISCTGDGEAFIRAGAARQLALLASSGETLERAARATLQDVADLGGSGGLIAVDHEGSVTMPFTAAAMNRGVWRAGEEPAVWV